MSETNIYCLLQDHTVDLGDKSYVIPEGTLGKIITEECINGQVVCFQYAEGRREIDLGKCYIAMQNLRGVAKEENK